MGPQLENGHHSPQDADSKFNMADLESELPPSLTETVPLGLLVDRVAAEVFRDLQVLAETCVVLHQEGSPS